MKQTILEAFGDKPGLVFFKHYFEDFKPGRNVKCPFHKDDKPSMSVMVNGLWKCFGCGEQGDIFTFYGLMNGLNSRTTDGFINILHGIVSEFQLNIQKQGKFDNQINILRKAQQNILQKDILEKILEIRGWNKNTIIKLKLGYMRERIWLPIYKDFTLINIRKYDFKHLTETKFYSLPKSDYPIWVFPNVNYSNEDKIFIFKESDVPLAIQLGLPAISITSGEGMYSHTLDYIFKDKIIYVCYDTDMKGICGKNKDPSEVLASQLQGIAKEVMICRLPKIILEGGEHADFTDYILAGSDFISIIDSAEKFVLKENDGVEEDKEKNSNNDAKTIEFSESIKAKYFGESFRTKAMCIGSSITTYIYPKTIRYKCKHGDSNRCLVCVMALHSGEKVIDVDQRINLLELITVTNNQKLGVLRNLIGVAKECKKLQIIVEEMANLEDIFVTEQMLKPKFNINVSTQIRQAYCIGTGITPNKTYEFSGTLINDPKSQRAVNLFKERKMLSSDIDNFKLSKDDIANLSVFNTDCFTETTKRIGEILKDIRHNITKMIERDDVALVTLLTYLSPLTFNFNGTEGNRGWIETLIFGDTQTGKSETAKKLMGYLEVGSYHLCERATHAGLVGGVKYVGRTGIVVWGIIPMNDRGLVMLDEVSGLDIETLGRLTGVRDSGVAESNTVEGIRQAMARTRKIWISNPRSNRPLKGYNSGIHAVRELVGRPEDIARFDLLVVCSSDDVSLHNINSAPPEPIQGYYTDNKLLYKLVMWAWSRQQDNYNFSTTATKLILDYSTEMAEQYSEEFPIVLGAQQRFKLARISIAIATLMFSTRQDAEKIYVEGWHVQQARALMDRLFAKKACGYKQFSALHLEHTINQSTVIAKLNKLGTIKKKTFVYAILEGYTFTMYDIRAYLGCSKVDREQGDEMLNFLVAENCIVKATKIGYRKTSGFTAFLRDVAMETEVPF